jgi:cell division protein FtsI (penicillin-binding protein 3)
VSTAVKSVNYATSPLLASPTPPWRSRLVVFLVAAAFLLLLGRAVHLQILHTSFYQAQGEKRFLHNEKLPASRGRVLDRNGLALASSVALPTVQVDTKLFAADAAERKQLAQLLALSPAELADKLDNPGTVVLRRTVEEPVWAEIKALDLKGLQEIREYKRRYPEGEAAAPVVGFVDPDGTGLSGIELVYNQPLTGAAGQRTVVRDRFGRVVEDMGEPSSPVNGRDVALSIDSKVQFFAWQRLRDAVKEHNALSGSAVVLDVQTGELLALANYRTEDPVRRNAKGASKGPRNGALADTFEPGSTMKPFTASLALERGPWKADTRIDTAPGRIVIAGAPITDSHPHGMLTVAEVIQKSSNVGTVKMAMTIPAREMWEMYTAIGLGQRPQLDFPGAAPGRLRPYKTWRQVEQATMSYGYGQSASLLQLARAYTVFARDGEIIPLTLIKRDAAEGLVAGQRVFSARTAQQVRDMLRMAAGPGGTAPKAQALGYSVAGKTGTARKHEGKGYANGKYLAFFVGVAPATNPRIVVAVLVDEPAKGVYFGGDVAAPVFSQVVQQTLRMMNVQPDLDVKAQINAKPVAAEQESI